MKFIPKSPSEVIPLIFDYRTRLGGLAAGATIQSVDALTVDPTGELSIGTIGEALIDELSQIEVAVVATGGTSPKIYACTCRSTVNHSGSEYVFDVVLHVLVR